MTRLSSLETAIAALRDALREVGSPFMLIGGVAVIARGIARVTTDVDATLRAADIVLEDLLITLEKYGIRGRIPDLLAFARRSQVLLLVHEPSRTPIEVSLAWLPFEEEALARAEQIDLGTGDVPVATAEDLIIYKAVAWRERDRADIERLLVQHGDQCDLGRIRRVVKEFADAIDAPERASQLELILQRARSSE